MANTNIQNPKLTISSIKSPLSGGGSNLGNVGQGGTSKIGTLAKIVRKNRISINSLVKSQKTQDEKITILKNISQNRQSNIGQKLPDSGGSNIEKSLTETNQILVQIQQELMRGSALRSQEEKAKLDRAKRGASRAKLSVEDSELEKSSKRIKKSVGEKAEQTVAPVKGIFGRIMDFLGTLALGIASNAIFEWLKDPSNMEKVKGWFNWIKENWGWAAVAIGAIALMPLAGVITTIIGTLSALAPLLIPIAPLLLKALLIVGGIVLAYKGLEAGFNAVRNATTGGSEYSAAHDVLDQKLRDAGLDQDGKKREGGFLGMGRKEVEMTEDEKKLAADVLAKRKQLNSMRDDMRADIQKKNLEIDEQAGLSMSSSDSAIQATQSSRSEAEKEIKADYARRITEIVPLNIEARAKGGPVAPGTPYLVGEEGPELRVFEKGGSIISNPKTKNLLRNITPNKTKKTNIVTMDLPPQMLNSEKSPPARPAEPPIPKIPSTNVADMWRSKTPEMYGISV